MSGAAAGNGRQYAAPGIMLRTAGNMLLPLVLSLRDSICCCRLCCCCEIQHVAAGNMLHLAICCCRLCCCCEIQHVAAGNMLHLAICCCRLCCRCEIQCAANCRQYAAPGCEIQHAANGRQYAATDNILLTAGNMLHLAICCCRLC